MEVGAHRSGAHRNHRTSGAWRERGVGVGSVAREIQTEVPGFYRGEFTTGFSVEDAPEFGLWPETDRRGWRALFGEPSEGVSRLEGEKGF